MKHFGLMRVVAACAVVALLTSGCVFIVRVDNSSSGAQSDNGAKAVAPAISRDGRYVAFESSASNLGMPPGGYGEIYKRDLQTNTTTPISVPTNGPGFAANGPTIGEPAISDDGRYVAFTSGASNLVANDDNNDADVFRRDTETGTTVRVDLDAGGNELASGVAAFTRPSMSGNGRYITFVTTANLATGDVPGSVSVYRKDMNTGAVVLVSTGNGFTSGTNPSMSRNGNVIAFESSAPLVAGDTGMTDIYVRNISAGTITRASLSTAGVQPDSHSVDAAISGDGGRVVFFSDARNLVTGAPADPNAFRDAFQRVLDPTIHTTTRVTLTDSEALANNQLSITSAATHCPAGISDDGRYVAFMTTATNFVAMDANGVGETVFVRDMKANTTQLVDADQNGAQKAPGTSLCPQVSGDGRYIAFVSNVNALVLPDVENFDMFVRANPVPTFTNVSPAAVSRGTTTTVTVTGTHFITTTPGAVTAYFGEKIAITATNRVSESQVKFTIEIDAEAGTGSRTVFVYNPGTGPGALATASTQFALTVT